MQRKSKRKMFWVNVRCCAQPSVLKFKPLLACPARRAQIVRTRLQWPLQALLPRLEQKSGATSEIQPIFRVGWVGGGLARTLECLGGTHGSKDVIIHKIPENLYHICDLCSHRRCEGSDHNVKTFPAARKRCFTSDITTGIAQLILTGPCHPKPRPAPT